MTKQQQALEALRRMKSCHRFHSSDCKKYSLISGVKSECSCGVDHDIETIRAALTGEKDENIDSIREGR